MPPRCDVLQACRREVMRAAVHIALTAVQVTGGSSAWQHSRCKTRRASCLTRTCSPSWTGKCTLSAGVTSRSNAIILNGYNRDTLIQNNEVRHT